MIWDYPEFLLLEKNDSFYKGIVPLIDIIFLLKFRKNIILAIMLHL